MYSEEDIKGALFSYDSVKEDFVNLIKEIAEILKEFPRTTKGRPCLKHRSSNFR